jgi:hypothetical protein
LRDDLNNLFRQLAAEYSKKLQILEKISGNETQLHFFLQSDKIPEIFELIQEDNDLFIKIDSVEFDIQDQISKICKISGIEKENFNNYFLDKKEEPLPELKELKEKTKKYLSGLIKERDMFIKNMESKLAELKLDIDSMRFMRNLKKNIIH